MFMDNLPYGQTIQSFLILFIGLFVFFIPMVAKTQDPPPIPKLVADEFPE